MEEYIKYQLISIKTVMTNNNLESGLSFFEGEHDIPFKINRLYCTYENEEKKLKGFHSDKQGWQLMFCPYGIIELIIDDGEKKEKILLDKPSVGLILRPGVCHEINWKRSNSVLCVATSGHYESEKLRDDYELDRD